jgi:hypothetical protein
MIEQNLCYYDPRNPDGAGNKTGQYLKDSGLCMCDNCFYGRTELAEHILGRRFGLLTPPLWPAVVRVTFAKGLTLTVTGVTTEEMAEFIRARVPLADLKGLKRKLGEKADSTLIQLRSQHNGVWLDNGVRFRTRISAKAAYTRIKKHLS